MSNNYLSESQLRAFDEDGFLVVPSVVDESALSAVRRAFAARVADLLRRYNQLGIGDGAADDFDSNIRHLLSVAPQAYQHIDISLPMLHDYTAPQKEWQRLFGDDWRDEAGIFADDSVFNLLTCPNIIRIARQLVGDEVIASPVQHTRIKPPQRLLAPAAQIDANTARTLWHQDEAVVTEDARGVNVLTVWIAITDATVANGCMEAARGSHRDPDTAARPDFGLASHCPGKGDLVGEIYIADSQVDRARITPLEARAGDVILLHKRVVHGAGVNTSDGVRWSFDLRYQPARLPNGRDCFPNCVVASADSSALTTAAQYRQQWHDARDQIISGERQAVFNDRWNKYADATLCA